MKSNKIIIIFLVTVFAIVLLILAKTDLQELNIGLKLLGFEFMTKAMFNNLK